MRRAIAKQVSDFIVSLREPKGGVRLPVGAGIAAARRSVFVYDSRTIVSGPSGLTGGCYAEACHIGQPRLPRYPSGGAQAANRGRKPILETLIIPD
jgi:hypothetical protein